MAEKEWTEEKVRVGDTELVIVKGGKGKPLLLLHGELGWPGWTPWNSALAKERTLIAPIHPGFGKTAMADWIMSIRDLAGFYQRYVREQKLGPIDVLGHSLGGWIAAEMAAANPGAVQQNDPGRAGRRPSAAGRNHGHVHGDRARLPDSRRG